MEPVKEPGWKTSSFWVACGAAIITALSSFVLYLQGSIDGATFTQAIMVTVGVIATYIVSRIFAAKDDANIKVAAIERDKAVATAEIHAAAQKATAIEVAMIQTGVTRDGRA